VNDLTAPSACDQVSSANLDQQPQQEKKEDLEAKPLPPLPDTSSPPRRSSATLRRMSGDKKLRDTFNMDSNRQTNDTPAQTQVTDKSVKDGEDEHSQASGQ
jgi:hypothetical protein